MVFCNLTFLEATKSTRMLSAQSDDELVLILLTALFIEMYCDFEFVRLI